MDFTKKMIPVKEEQRQWDFVTDKKLIEDLVIVKLNRRPLYLKASIPPAEFTPNDIKEDTIEFYFNPSLNLEQKIVLYLDLKRHFEFHFELYKIISPGIALLKPIVVKVSKLQRQYPRYTISNDQVMASNFRLSKNKISANNIQFQITTKIIFPQIENKYKEQFPGLKLFIASAENLPDEIKKQSINQPIFIQIHNKKTYIYPLVVYQRNKFVPLIYIFYPLDKTLTADEEILLAVDIEKLADETYEKIVEANTVLIQTRQRVLNISDGGVALEITDPELKKLIIYQDSITFDLNFKLVAPLRMYGAIKHIHKFLDDNHNEIFIVGIDFTGQGHTEFRKNNKDLLKNLIDRMVKQLK